MGNRRRDTADQICLPAAVSDTPLKTRAIGNLIRGLLYLPFTSLVMYLSRRWPIGGPRFKRHFVYHVLACVVVSIAQLVLHVFSLTVNTSANGPLRSVTFDASIFNEFVTSPLI